MGDASLIPDSKKESNFPESPNRFIIELKQGKNYPFFIALKPLPGNKIATAGFRLLSPGWYDGVMSNQDPQSSLENSWAVVKANALA